MFKFPDGFYWGGAASAYQVEGNNTNSDWWEWEIKAGKEHSGAACRHYEQYKQDFDLAKRLKHNAHRLSIEWARIEPVPGEYSGKELEHYRDVIRCLKDRGITPIVTLHHFTNPLWFSRLGGWTNKSLIGYFLRYAEKVVETLAEDVRFWVTINEPLVYVYHSYYLGDWPPQEKSLKKTRVVVNSLIRAHDAVYRLIHQAYARKKLEPPLVSIAHNVQAFLPCNNTFRNRLAACIRDHWYNFSLLNRLKRHKSLDYIGINYYTRSMCEPAGWRMRNMLIDTCERADTKKNSLGWDVYPQGLRDLLLRLKKYRLPVFILENGICADDDRLRWEFIQGHLRSLAQAMEQGVQVLGYIYWSLLDNFEWDKGFAPRFGLIEVDYHDYSRRIRESAVRFSRVCGTGTLEDEVNG